MTDPATSLTFVVQSNDVLYAGFTGPGAADAANYLKNTLREETWERKKKEYRSREEYDNRVYWRVTPVTTQRIDKWQEPPTTTKAKTTPASARSTPPPAVSAMQELGSFLSSIPE